VYRPALVMPDVEALCCKVASRLGSLPDLIGRGHVARVLFRVLFINSALYGVDPGRLNRH